MKRHILTLSSLLIALAALNAAGTVTSADQLEQYYLSRGMNNVSGASLWSAVKAASKYGYSSLSYDGLWTAYNTSDVDANGKIIDMYGGFAFTYKTKQCGNYTAEGDCYNREHSIPKSWFGGSESTNTPGTDLFHVVPTDGKINNTRSNYAFGEVGSAKNTHKTNGLVNKLGSALSITITNTMLGTTSTQTCSASTVFEPDDMYKGDFARGYMGTLLHWAGDYSSDFTSDAGSTTFSGTYTQAGHWGLTPYGIALLLKWHRQDPVSQKEIDRNNGIQQTQGNRNPFIDYPELAEYIWGSHAGETFILSNAVATFSSDYDPETGGMGVTEPFDVELYRNGLRSVVTGNTTAYTLPTDEADACDDWTFDGWATASVSATTTRPNYVTSTKKAGTFYAVYKNTQTTGGSGTSEASMTFSEQGLTSGASLDGQSLTMSNCTLTFAKNKANNAPAYYENGNAIRFYQGGTSMTVSSTSAITKIVLTRPSGNTGTVTADTGTLTDGTWTGSSTSVTFTWTANGRVSAIAVTAGGGSTTTTYASEPDCVITPDDPTATFTYPTLSVAFGELASNTLTTNSDGTVTYSSSNTAVASVDAATGELTIKGVGTATITASIAATTRYNAASASYTLTVTKGTPVLSVNAEPYTALKVGGEDQYEVSTTLGTIVYSSSNTQVATIDQTGYIRAVGAGTTHISATVAATANYVAAEAGYDLTVSEVKRYTITWSVSGVTTTATYDEGEQLTLPATTPADCDASGKTFVGWTSKQGYSGDTAPADLFTVATGAVTADTTYYAVYAAGSGNSTAAVTDQLTNANTVNSTSTTYTSWTATGTSGAEYAGQSGGGNTAIQLRSSNSNSGIVVTHSAGNVTRVAVTWNSNTTDGRAINIYGSNTVYTNATDLYDNSKQGELLGTIAKGTSTELNIEGDYAYIGIRSASGALYLNQVDITWGSDGSSATTYSDYTLTCGEVVEPTSYTISWSVDGATTTGQAEENSIVTMPDVDDCSEQRVFVGWTEDNLTLSEIITESPAATTDATYYAVFADKTVEDGTTVSKSLTFSDLELANAYDLTTESIVMDNCSLSFDKGTNNNAPKYYTAGTNVRIYQNNSLTISSDDNITAVSFAISGTNAGKVTTNVGTYADDSWTGSSKSVTFTNIGSSQWRFTEVTVTTGGQTVSYSGHSLFCTEPSFNVRFVVEGQAVQEEQLGYGYYAHYAGETPAKAEDDNFRYEFVGWDPDPDTTPIVGDTDFTAVFNPIDKGGTGTDIEVVGGRIVCDTVMSIFDIAGRNVTRQNGQLPQGTYIVRTAQKAQVIVIAY